MPAGRQTSMLILSRWETAVIVGVCVIGMLIGLLAPIPSGAIPSWLPHPRVNLGLDLQGGSYLLLEVDANAIASERLDNARAASLQALREAGIPTSGVVVHGDSLVLQLANEADVQNARTALAGLLSQRTGGPANALVFRLQVDGSRLALVLAEQALADLSSKAARQSIAIVRRRIDATGVNEPVVAQRGVQGDEVEGQLGS